MAGQAAAGIAGLGGCFRTQENRLIRDVLTGNGACPQEAGTAKPDTRHHIGARADEAEFADGAKPANARSRADEAVIADSRVMTDMRIAPHHHIVTKAGARFDQNACANKAVLANVGARAFHLRMDEADEPVSAFLAFHIAITPQLIHPSETDRAEQADALRRKAALEVLPGHHGPPHELVPLAVSCIDREADDSVLRVRVEVHRGNLGGCLRPEQNDISHPSPRSGAESLSPEVYPRLMRHPRARPAAPIARPAPMNKRPSAISDPRATALRLLGRREHAGRELQRKLEQRGIARQDAAATVEALERDGWQSDARYAERLIEARIAQAYGPRWIEAALRAAGVDAELARRSLEACGADWLALAHVARERRYGREAAADIEERSRQYRHLAGRGFEADQIRAALGGQDGED